MSDWTDAVNELDEAIAGFYDVPVGTALKSITIETTTRTIDNNGELANSWSTFAAVSNVLVTDMAMRETENQAERVEALLDIEFDMPYTAGVTEEMRIVYDAKIYYISGVMVDETDSYRTIAVAHLNLAPDIKP